MSNNIIAFQNLHDFESLVKNKELLSYFVTIDENISHSCFLKIINERKLYEFTILVKKTNFSEQELFTLKSFNIKTTNNNELYKEIVDLEKRNEFLFNINESTFLIGDIHGDYIALTNLLTKIGFNIINNKIKSKNKKIILLGDFINKGYDSINVMKLILNSESTISAIKGNHELEFEKLLDCYLEHNKIISTKPTYKKTLFKFIEYFDRDSLIKILNFLKELPTYIIFKYKNHKFILCHANIDFFSKKSRKKTFYMSELNSDAEYLFNASFNIHGYKTIHGHTRSVSDKLEHVCSLETGVCFENGYISALDFTSYVKELDLNNETYFKNFIIKEKSHFYNEEKKTKTIKNYSDFFKHSKKEGMTFVDNYNKSGFFFFYKRNKSFNLNDFYSTNELIKKANGIVFNFDESILINPMSIFFKYNSKINDKNEVHYFAEKPDGVIINIAYSSIQKEYLFSTSEYFMDKKYNAYFNKIINDYSYFFDKNKNSGKTYTFCTNGKTTYLLSVNKNNNLLDNEDIEIYSEFNNIKENCLNNLYILNSFKEETNKMIVLSKKTKKEYFALDDNKNNILFEIINF